MTNLQTYTRIGLVLLAFWSAVIAGICSLYA
jgi:hypothetical protein